MSRPGLEPGPSAWEVSTLEKSHLDSLYAGCSEPLLMMRLAPFIQTSTIYILEKEIINSRDYLCSSNLKYTVNLLHKISTVFS
jgi:hypothetical protein